MAVWRPPACVSVDDVLCGCGTASMQYKQRHPANATVRLKYNCADNKTQHLYDLVKVNDTAKRFMASTVQLDSIYSYARIAIIIYRVAQ